MKSKSGQTIRHHVAFGFTLIEFLAFIALIACVLAGIHIGHGKIGSKFGWLLGGFLGFLAFFVILFALVTLVDFGFKGVPRLPKCRNGSCRGPGLFGYSEDYDIQKIGEEYVRVCRCGGRYKRRGRRFVMVNEDGAETPYLIWRPFRGWFPDVPPAKS